MYLILNFKTYEQATGKEALELADIVHDAQKNTQVQIVICPQATDIFRIKQTFPEIILWSQHTDPLEPGRNSGWITPLAVKDSGGSGTLLNHSEHGIIDEMIVHSLIQFHEDKLQTCLCIPNPLTIENIKRAHKTEQMEGELFAPSFVAYEPPELIGGDYSALDSHYHIKETEEALKTIQAFNSIPLLGAGIKDSKDITNAIKMGYEGALIASGFVKSDNPAKFLDDVLGAFPT